MANIENWEVASIDDTGNLSLDGSVTASGGTVGSIDTFSAGDAINPALDSALTSNAGAYTLADGSNGKRLLIRSVFGTAVVTPATLAGSDTTITLDVTEYVDLLFITTTGWAVVSTTGVVA